MSQFKNTKVPSRSKILDIVSKLEKLGYLIDIILYRTRKPIDLKMLKINQKSSMTKILLYCLEKQLQTLVFRIIQLETFLKMI